jgi:hypothetical protein
MSVTIRPSPEKVGQNRDATAKSERDPLFKLVSKWEKDLNYEHRSKACAGKLILYSSFNDVDVKPCAGNTRRCEGVTPVVVL